MRNGFNLFLATFWIFLLFNTFIFLTACDNARHRINVNTNPFSDKFNEKTKLVIPSLLEKNEKKQ
jgi:elongation factor P hydroxylase